MTRGSRGPLTIEIKYRERPDTPLITYHLSVDEAHGRPVITHEWLRWKRKPYGAPFRFLENRGGEGQAVSGEVPDEEDQRVDIALSSPDLLAVNALGQFREHPRVGALRTFITGWHVSYLSADSARGQPEAGPRDDEDCHVLKAKLEAAAAAALPTRSHAGASRWQVANRIVVEELEAWYFGDWDAVREAYPRVSAHIPRRATYRDPDAIKGGTWEAFERVMRRHGYFTTGLRKVEAAQAIGEHVNPDRNRSNSFGVFRRILRESTTQ